MFSQLFMVALLLTGTLAYAQTGNIAGTITDETGAGVPGATVPLGKYHHGDRHRDQRCFRISIANLTAGAYNLTIEKEGFTALRVRNIALTVAQNLTLNQSLQVGVVSQSVEVAGEWLRAIDPGRRADQ